MMKTNARILISVVALAVIIFFRPHVPCVLADDIIDNGDPQTSFTGEWNVSGGANPWDPADPAATSLWSRNGDTYTWTFTPTDSGYHDLSMWWTEWASRSSNIPVDIEFWRGTDQLVINQQLNGGQWNHLNTYPFEAGVSYDITLTSQPGPSSTNADAVQFIFQPALNVPPVAIIDSISPSPALIDDLVVFAGQGDDLDGSIIAYGWDSDIDGHLGDTATLNMPVPLSPGTHTIAFTVTDDDNETTTVTQPLIVQTEITEFIIDNGDPQTSFTGDWSVSGGANPWNPTDPGATSLWARGGDTYTWTFTPTTSANYAVSMWHTEWSSRSTSVPVSVEYSGGTDSVTINQQINGGAWNLLGTYPFEAGGSYAITVTSQPDPASTSADAVKFVKVGDINLAPTATIDSITPTAALPGDEITFSGSGSDNDGSVVAYEWYSDIDDVLSDQAAFSTNSLSPGTHTIFFRAQDDEGAWSAQAVALVVVRDCNSPIAIMLLGNSITYGIGEVATADLITGYRAPLFQSLKNAGYYVDFVGDRQIGLLVVPPYDIDHQGDPGIADNEVAVNVYDWLTANPAEVVLLHIGTNDFDTNPNDVEDILNEIDRYEADNNTEITVVLAKIINRMTPHADTTTFNSNIEAMALSRIATGDKIVIVDQEGALEYTTDMWDLIHPKNTGYEKMSAEWINGLAQLLPLCADFGPFIFSTPVETVMVGSPYPYQVGALGNPEPTYSLLAFPAGMTIDTNTGEISWTPVAGQEGSHAVTVQASNSQGTDTQNFNIEVSNEIIIDNGDPQTSFTGNWRQSSGENPWDPADPAATSLWSRDGSTYTWTFTPTTTGNYEVSMWHTAWPSRSTGVPVSIEFSGGTDSVTINQQVNGGIWNALGTYLFEAGMSYNITVTSQPDPSSTCADAVKFELTAPTAPSITSHPADQSVVQGEPATFSVEAAGSEPISYQWQRDLVDIPGATGNSYTIAAATLADSGAQFRCVATNVAGSATSVAATLTVNPAIAPGITGQPASQNVAEGAAATFNVTATGSAPLSYQWQKDGVDIGGATASTYTTPATTLADSGAQFRCVVTNAYGSATSAAATLTVNIAPPSITGQPASQSVAEGAAATFNVTAAGSAPLSYQWQKNGVDIGGATASAYTTPATTLADSGTRFRCVVTNAVGSATSAAATLTVIESQPPTAFNDSADTMLNTPVRIDVVANDNDNDGTIDPTSVAVTSPPSNGTAVEQGDGTVLYTPNGAYTGKDVFTYTVADNSGALSNTASVTVTVGIIIDNGDPQTSFTGEWSISKGADPFDPADPGATSLWARNGPTYTWTFTPDVAGNYEVSMWYTYLSSRSSSVPVDIEHWGGTDTVNVNQQLNGGRWNVVGTYPFDAGVSYDITVTAVPAGTGNFSTCADAVRFVQIPTNAAPLATIDSISPEPALPGETVTLAGSGTDFEGPITGYNWYSTLDGPLSDQATFSTSTLSEGVHSIFFKVRDNSGRWSAQVQTSIDVNNRLVQTTEHIFFAPAYASVNAMQLMVNTLNNLGATRSGSTWTYINASRNKKYIIHAVTSNQQFIDALKTEGATILYFGHSNYGIGQLFATDQEFKDQVIEDIRYVDDDRLLATSSPVVHVNVGGMRTGQAYPHWWPIFKDGTSAIMPYEKGDPAGPPAYNYYPTYRIPGDPRYYKIETVRNSAIERFPDWSGPAWYDPNGNPPDPNNPYHDRYYITNSEPWSPSFERSGNWVDTNAIEGFFRENYEYSAPGSGTDQVTWRFSIPSAANYNVYAWYPAASGNATDSPFTVNHALGSTTIPVNQRLNGGQWYPLGAYQFGVGDYSVVLTDDANNGNVVADGIRIEHVNNPPQILKADFYATNRSGPAPLTVTFDSENVGDVDSFRWDFGDGEGNTTRTFVNHTYVAPGTYTVSLTINGPLGTDTTTEVGYITVGAPEPPLKAEFESRTSQQGIAPHTAIFRDRSSGDIVSWQWDFDGDGVIDSTKRSPVFTYAQPGNYTVTLTTTDTSANTDTEVKATYVRVSVFDKNIDNVDYPKRHYRSKTLLFRKNLEVAKEDMKYDRLFYGGCDSAHYYTDTFQRGIYHFATNSTGEGEYAMADYLTAYVNGASDYELWQVIQATEPLYDYYDFRKPPSEQW